MGWGVAELGASQTVERKLQMCELQTIAKCRTLSNCLTLCTSRPVHVSLMKFQIKMLLNIHVY